MIRWKKSKIPFKYNEWEIFSTWGYISQFSVKTMIHVSQAKFRSSLVHDIVTIKAKSKIIVMPLTVTSQILLKCDGMLRHVAPYIYRLNNNLFIKTINVCIGHKIRIKIRHLPYLVKIDKIKSQIGLHWSIQLWNHCSVGTIQIVILYFMFTIRPLVSHAVRCLSYSYVPN